MLTMHITNPTAKGIELGNDMKKQNDPNKTNYYTMYEEQMPTHQRVQDAVKEASGDCWWIEQYLRNIMNKRKP